MNTQPATSPNGPDAQAAVRLIETALPFATLEELLVRLSRFWLEELVASSSVLAVRSRDGRHFVATAGEQDAIRVLSGRAATDELRATALAGMDQGDPHRWIPLGANGDVVAGLALWWSDSQSAYPEIHPAAITATARLLAHGRDLEHRLRDAKLESMAEFAAGAGHEINNPLTSIVRYAQVLKRGETDPERLRALNTIGGQAYRVRDMIGDAMLFARPPEPKAELLDIATLVDEAVARIVADFADSSPRLHVEIQPGLSVTADRSQFQVVLHELLRNAAEAIDAGGRIRVEARRARSDKRDETILTVSDDGRSLSETERVHLFDPYFSGRQAGRGLGFGLSKCWRIVAMHGGWIDVDADADEVRVTTCWPERS
ncbi:Sporulation kinase D [Maioricimonas rarisocia]|uniref:histidine kinase n=1 Tax=Maioricimonas rarisocia TaxID=2528026 RepID=A0A517Z2I5_9PLAN|nr:HAMP domain-containing sensor histidine kinase [Maioricimonas rarisocia]QDU36680.1 Sporulation kinase D [Maioricimonas rarisocia]